MKLKTHTATLMQTAALMATIWITQPLKAQTVTLVATTPASGAKTYSAETVVLEEGDSATIVSQYSQLFSSSATAIQIGNAEFMPPAFTSGVNVITSQTSGYTVAGPASIRAFIDGFGNTELGNKSAFVTLKITRKNSTPSLAPLNTVVIPESANGIFSVLLESSTDMITWTAANPGSYGGGTAKRFFRVRIVQQ